MVKKEATRQLILEATIACIEQSGLEALTTRRIAAQAGTNLASINYHFRSKDDLLQEVFSMTITHMLEDVFAALADDTRGFDAILRDVLFYLLDGAVRFPGITGAHLRRAVNEPESVSARGMARVFDGLTRRALQAYPARESRQLRLRTAQVMSSILFMMLRPGLFKVDGLDRLTNSEHARNLAASYTALFLTGIR